MISQKPYLIRAIYDWIVDNNWTPYLLVNADEKGVDVPMEHVNEGRIVLNASPMAVQHYSVSNDAIAFEARFQGVSRSLYVPVNALMAIYAKENGQGMAFPDDDDPLDANPSEDEVSTDAEPEKTVSKSSDSSSKKKDRGHLKVIK